jgi:hypothetical protein
MKRLVVAMAAAALMITAPGPAIGSTGPLADAPPVVAPSVVAPTGLTPTGMHMILDVSKNGRIALGRMSETGPVVIRDVVRNKTLRTLKSGPAYAYKTISSTGRYVHFTRTYTRSGCTYARPWVYDRVTNKARLAAATRSGKALRATWTSPNQCPYISSTEPAFEMHVVGGPGQMSPDGRYVAFCANLTDPARGDLYIKDMRTRKLTIRAGLCHLTAEANEFYPVHVSEGARTIMVLHNDQGSTDSYRADVVLRRRTVRNVALPGDAGARELWLTDDGRSIFYGVGSSPDAGRYDTSSGATAALTPGDPLRNEALQPGEEYRDSEAMTRRGRFVSYNGSRLDPNAVRVGLVGVFDRETGQAVDLTAAAGIPLQVGTSPVPNSLVPIQISGDGRVVFIGWGGWATLHWMP